jgi:hypothetical protein
MKATLAFLSLATLGMAAIAEQSPCDLIADEQLSEMHVARPMLHAESLSVPKEQYGTQADLVGSDCRYERQGSKIPKAVVLVSLVTVGSVDDEGRIRAALRDLYSGMQEKLGNSKFAGFSARSVESAWCSASASLVQSAELPMAGCAGVRGGEFLTVNYISEDADAHNSEDYKARAKGMGTRTYRYFGLIQERIAPEQTP